MFVPDPKLQLRQEEFYSYLQDQFRRCFGAVEKSPAQSHDESQGVPDDKRNTQGKAPALGNGHHGRGVPDPAIPRGQAVSGLEWTVQRGARGEWHWLCSLPNGWDAIVSDVSQVGVEIGPTFYLVSAVTKDDSITVPTATGEAKPFDSFTEAKQTAILLAAQQAMPLHWLMEQDEPAQPQIGLEGLIPPEDSTDDAA